MSIKRDELRLNAEFLSQRIQEMDLKSGWVADQIRVDRKTLSRWMNGHVKWAKKANIEALSALLECPFEKLAFAEEVADLATPEDQKNAAHLISDQKLRDILAPSSNWKMLESVIRSSLRPDLPLPLIAELYNDLAMAEIRQDRLAEARTHAGMALGIGERVAHTQIIGHSYLHLATADTLEGLYQKSFDHYEIAIDHLMLAGDDRFLAKAFSNLGTALVEWGDVDEGAKRLRQAIELFERLTGSSAADGIALAIAYRNYGTLYLELEQWEGFALAAEKSLKESQRSQYQWGLHYGLMMQALAFARAGDTEKAIKQYTTAHESIRLLFDSPQCYEMGARIFRLLQRWDEAQALLDQGATHLCVDIERAFWLLEQGHLSKARGDLSAAHKSFTESLHLFQQLNMPLRIEKLRSTMQS